MKNCYRAEGNLALLGSSSFSSGGAVHLTLPLDPPMPFLRGDANEDGLVDLADGIFLLFMHLAPGSPQPACCDAADANDDSELDIADGVYVLSMLFVPGTPAMPEPFPLCGTDPTQGAVFCEVATPCP